MKVPPPASFSFSSPNLKTIGCENHRRLSFIIYVLAIRVPSRWFRRCGVMALSFFFAAWRQSKFLAGPFSFWIYIWCQSVLCVCTIKQWNEPILDHRCWWLTLKWNVQCWHNHVSFKEERKGINISIMSYFHSTQSKGTKIFHVWLYEEANRLCSCLKLALWL